MTEILRVQGIQKSFGYRKLLKGLDFSLQGGEALMLLGRNGEGKSTLLKIITGLMRPEQGEVLFKGQRVQDNPEGFRSAMGVISHQIHFYNELTAAENLQFFCALKGGKDLLDKIHQALLAVGLSPFANSRVGTFSSGMGKRLGIARLMVSEPEILFLDEPYTGLDYDSIEFFNNYLVSFKEAGGSLVMVTHQIDLFYPISDQILILRQGQFQSIDKHHKHSYEELLTQYQEISS